MLLQTSAADQFVNYMVNTVGSALVVGAILGIFFYLLTRAR